ncbi:MAG: hypothetical protein CVU91_09175 [Firmicutes bacterium HGW-Firmicutes-16]|nr:MAG: hypothetical protein CVU91_09175 [Firmicutes bacterium HGW-Firmicutes-16]
MYTEINEKLELARQGIARLHKIYSMISQLEAELGPLEQKEHELKKALEKENLDVEKLKNRSISSVLFSILGSLDKHIQKENAEALAAKLKYDQALRDVEDIEHKISNLYAERSKYVNCQSEYDSFFEQKKELLMRDNAETAQKIMELTEEIGSSKIKVKETREAIIAGNNVLSSLNSVLCSLDSAAGWGTWDMLGGGLISDLAKHSNIDNAKYEIENTQRLIMEFKTELADVKISSDIGIHIDGFSKFADFFFDGIFADWNMQTKINRSWESVLTVKIQVESVISKLKDMLANDENRINSLETEINSLITRA